MTKYVTPEELRLVQKHLMDTDSYFIAGSSSIFVPKGKQKYVNKNVCKPWPDLHGQSRLTTPGQAARLELARQWPKLKKVGWPAGDISLLSARSPMHYTGQVSGDLVYIDLDSAYAQIYRNLWLDTMYPRGYYGKYPLRNIADTLETWKAARNALMGIARSTEAVAFRGHQRIKIRTENKYLSPALWATVQEVLHVVAAKAVELGAVYINTDGYVFHRSPPEFYEDFVFWLSGQGFRWSPRCSGDGEIVGWNNYRIGYTKTKQYKLNLRSSIGVFSNVNFMDRERWQAYYRACQRISSASDAG